MVTVMSNQPCYLSELKLALDTDNKQLERSWRPLQYHIDTLRKRKPRTTDTLQPVLSLPDTQSVIKSVSVDSPVKPVICSVSVDRHEPEIIDSSNQEDELVKLPHKVTISVCGGTPPRQPPKPLPKPSNDVIATHYHRLRHSVTCLDVTANLPRGEQPLIKKYTSMLDLSNPPSSTMSSSLMSSSSTSSGVSSGPPSPSSAQSSDDYSTIDDGPITNVVNLPQGTILKKYNKFNGVRRPMLIKSTSIMDLSVNETKQRRFIPIFSKNKSKISVDDSTGVKNSKLLDSKKDFHKSLPNLLKDLPDISTEKDYSPKGIPPPPNRPLPELPKSPSGSPPDKPLPEEPGSETPDMTEEAAMRRYMKYFKDNIHTGFETLVKNLPKYNSERIK